MCLSFSPARPKGTRFGFTPFGGSAIFALPRSVVVEGLAVVVN
jgi:hypothetical protein